MYKIYDWLRTKLAAQISGNTIMIDVGAYHGDFSRAILDTNKITKAIMFEPNPDHYANLKNQFSEDKNIFLYPYALGNEVGTHHFNCSQDDATGSLLPYHEKYHHENTQKMVRSFSVEVRRLDDLIQQDFSQEKISLIKIDTQGFDLEVLKGAEKIIQEHQPWLVIELNFLPFYASQSPIHALFNWLAERGYHLGGFFNDHYSGDQWLAFADGVFVPNSVVDKVLEPFIMRQGNDELIEQNAYLQTVCDERLALINRLSVEADHRLEIINTLKNTAKKAKKLFWF